MSSRTAWPLSETEASSVDLVGPVSQRLAWWVAHTAEHARFLNTLALMEHIGSRKIMVSQTKGALGQEILKHLAEETRHSYFFKRAAETIVRRPLEFNDADTIRPASAKMYFGRLDASIDDALGPDVHHEIPYLYVSLTIELRAIWTYRLYHQALAEHGSPLSLKSVLAEEEMHLTQMLDRLRALNADPERRVPAFARVEDRLFRIFWTALDGACEALPRAA
ncbi:MAG: hypothetical protein IPK78_15515 [Rhodospirillales bacterium]|nr:hypothetical protein [Rhodospirillales bacterium]